MGKRVKHVFSGGELAHVWASQSQEDGRNPGYTFFFEKETIYSYRWSFPIARFHKMPNGVKVVLFDEHSYSMTTSGHQADVRWAIQDLGLPVIYLHSMFWHNYIAGRDYYIQAIKGQIDLSSRAIKYAGYHINTCAGLIFTLHQWGIYHKRHPRFKFSDADKVILKRAKDQKIKVAKRERIAAEKEEVKRQERLKLLNEECGGDMNVYWRKYGNLPMGYSAYTYLLDTLCRVDGDEVVTSMGAKVPIEHAKRLLKLVKRCHDEQYAFVPGSAHPFRIGYYQVQDIQDNGDVKIGCHKIKWSEIEILGKQLLPDMFGGVI